MSKSSRHKLWFSILSKDACYASDEEKFINPETFDWTKNSEKITKEIKEELLNYLSQHSLQAYFNTKMSDDVKKWKTISLKWWGLEFYSRQKFFSKTTAFINSIPNLVSASFNLLEPQSRIYPHCGDTNGIYRCHLGLIIPAQLPECGFRVEDEKRSWEEGKWLIFIDAKEHEAWNESNENRFILLIDIIRPEFANQKNKIVLTSLTGLFLQKLAESFPVLYKFQNNISLKRRLVYILIPFCFLASKIRNLLSKCGLVS
ncbi:MAG: hypothetical protein KatS3mg027_0073 [Bacteroidia bacterium]|nr:MAG: hypothetical protein KatS3mg027_0073 [Bacteroidia bacterium]